MSDALLPRPTTDRIEAGDPRAVTEEFLRALAASEVERAMSLVDEDIEYTNVGLPTIRGRRRVERAMSGLERPSLNFEVYLHNVSADGPVVLTERTDVISIGPFRSQFWVCGRFEVRDGLITVWRDYFDTVDILRASARGLLGIALPGVRPAPPGPGAHPGR